VNIIKSLLGHKDDQDSEIVELRRRLEESEKKVEKLLDMVNILATFDEQMAKDLRTVASHVALMEMSIMNKRKRELPLMKRKSNDDDVIN